MRRSGHIVQRPTGKTPGAPDGKSPGLDLVAALEEWPILIDCLGKQKL